MFYEHSNTNRENWKYPYTGTMLLLAAETCYERFHNAEMEARNKLADLMRDPNVSQSDTRISELKRQIESNGKQAEACWVFIQGFEREPDRVFQLSLGDVVYFFGQK